MKIAIPAADGKLAAQGGRTKAFVLVAVENDEITGMEIKSSPPEDPGLLPTWLKEYGVSVVICRDMGARAIRRLQQSGIEVKTGYLPEEPEDLIARYLDNDRKPPP